MDVQPFRNRTYVVRIENALSKNPLLPPHLALPIAPHQPPSPIPTARLLVQAIAVEDIVVIREARDATGLPRERYVLRGLHWPPGISTLETAQAEKRRGRVAGTPDDLPGPTSPT